MTTQSNVRTRSEIVDGELLPPELQVRGDPPAELIEAVEAALERKPNAVTEPVLIEANPSKHADAILAAVWNELPVTEDGDLVGWYPPYIAQEHFTEKALTETLPEGAAYEWETSDRVALYTEGL